GFAVRSAVADTDLTIAIQVVARAANAPSQVQHSVDGIRVAGKRLHLRDGCIAQIEGRGKTARVCEFVLSKRGRTLEAKVRASALQHPAMGGSLHRGNIDVGDQAVPM